MAAPYLVEIRTGGKLKNSLQNIIYDIAEEFNVRGVAEPRAVPHITLFGPYNTNHGNQVKHRLLDVYADYDLVPYCVDGFSYFRDNNVIYARMVPSPELRELRRDISQELRPITYNARPWDTNYFYNFHITVAFKDVGEKFDDIWSYVNEEYNPQYEEYATRITNLRQGDMMWEYDLLQNRDLDPNEATSAESWQRTTELLNEQSTSADHSQLAPEPNKVAKYLRYYRARLLNRW